MRYCKLRQTMPKGKPREKRKDRPCCARIALLARHGNRLCILGMTGGEGKIDVCVAGETGGSV